MKKVIAMIALAAVCFGSTASAFTTIKAAQDTIKKTKVKRKLNKTKIKKKVVKKDTTATQ